MKGHPMNPQQEDKGLSLLTTKIVLRATALVCVGLSPARIEAVAYPLAEAIVDIVIAQGNSTTKPQPVRMSNYTTFELWNQILDEVAKCIPCVDDLEVIGCDLTRSQRKRFLEGKWRTEGNT